MDSNQIEKLSHRLNTEVSENGFKRSCEIIRQNCRHADPCQLRSILANNDEGKSYIEFDNRIYVWYFAIGSMINPISVYLRDLTPIVSYPARCPNYRLVFRDRCGMADIEYCPGGDFDGVVHLLPIEQMIRLDQVEHVYQRTLVNVIDYHQVVHCVYVYKMNQIDGEPRPITLPSERYLDIIVKGCQYFSVRSSYINRLKNDQPVIPRKSTKEYKTIENVPEDVQITIEDLHEHDGSAHDLPIWISINGKVLEYVGLPPIDDPDYEHEVRFHDFIKQYFAGREVVHIIGRTWYEPTFQIPLNEHDVSDEYRRWAEDLCASCGLNNFGDYGRFSWRPKGRLVRT